MLQRCIAAQLAKDLPRAQLYASECAEIRKMAKIVLGSEISLERAIIRLQTVEQLGELLYQILPVVGVIQDTKQKIEGIIPGVASELGKVHSLLDDTVRETGTIQLKESDMILQDEEAKRIFQESNIYAEQRLREEFPEPPPIEQNNFKISETDGVEQIQDRPMERIPSQPSVPSQDQANGQTARFSIQELPSRVYEYITNHVNHRGKLNLTECATTLGVARDDVVKAIEELQGERRIILQRFDHPTMTQYQKEPDQTDGT